MGQTANSFSGHENLSGDKFAGKVVLINGLSDNGRSIAEMFAHQGAIVSIAYSSHEEKAAQELRRQIESEGQICMLIGGDMYDEYFRKDAVYETRRAFGRVDAVVNTNGQMLKAS